MAREDNRYQCPHSEASDARGGRFTWRVGFTMLEQLTKRKNKIQGIPEFTGMGLALKTQRLKPPWKITQ